MNFASRIAATLAVAAVAVLVLANAVVDRLSARSPAIAAEVWPSHPAVEISRAMQDIAKGARAGRPADPQALLMLEDAAGRAPLAPEPFLAHGVAAQLAGQTANAEASFKAAKFRDPRSLPARYFLSGLYLQSNDIRRGLKEVAEFAAMSPNGIAAIGPYIAAVAAKRSTWPELRALFRQAPAIEQASLTALAADPANADTVIALQGGRRKAAEAPWIGALVSALVNHRDYGRARAYFSMALDPPPAGDSLVFDPGFDQPEAPPPFNWALASSTAGLAERQAGGRLHVIFYGQEDGVLANQLLVLPAGAYRLSMSVSGGDSALAPLAWKARCANDGREIMSVALSARGPARFTVPANCPAQWLELSGQSGDVARASDVTIAGLSLKREGPGA